MTLPSVLQAFEFHLEAQCLLSTEPTAGNQERGEPWISVVQTRWYPIRKARYRIRTSVIRTFRGIVVALSVIKIRQSSGQPILYILVIRVLTCL